MSPSVVDPLNLILYMPFKILAYLSNNWKASFDRMDSMLACGTLKNLRLFFKSGSFSERAPAMKLTCCTAHPWRPSVRPSADFREAFLCLIFGPD